MKQFEPIGREKRRGSLWQTAMRRLALGIAVLFPMGLMGAIIPNANSAPNTRTGAQRQHQAARTQAARTKDAPRILLASTFPTPTPSPTPPPTGSWVFVDTEYVENLDSSDKPFEPSVDAGSISISASNNLEAGTLGQIWFDVDRTDSVTTTYNYEWQSDGGLAPGPYTPSYTFDYSGSASGSASGGCSKSMGGRGSGSPGGGAELPANGGEQSYSNTIEGSEQSAPSEPYLSLSQTLTLRTSLHLHASNGQVDGDVTHSATGEATLD